MFNTNLGKVVSGFNDKIRDFTGGILDFTKTGPYPNIEGVTSRVLPGNWCLSYPYSFKVEGAESPIAGGLTPKSGLFKSIGGILGGGLFDEFIFTIAPQEIHQTEQFAINITPTQNGIVSEHNGVVFKELTISGTFGQRATNNFVSGYEVMMNLKNYFRAYSQLKTDPSQKNMRLIWINRKDNERFVVEPISVAMDRSADAPFLYRYNIVCKVLGFAQAEIFPGIVGDFFNQVSSWSKTVGDIIDSARYRFISAENLLKIIRSDFREQILEPIDTINLAFKKTNNKEYKVSDLPARVVRELSQTTIKKILDQAVILKNNGNKVFANIALPDNTLKESQNNGYRALNVLPIEGLKEISIAPLNKTEIKLFQTEIALALQLTEKYYQDYYEVISETTDDAYEKFGFDMANYNNLIGRENKYSNIETDRIISYQEYDLLRTFRDAQKALEIILSTDNLFQSPVSDYFDFARDNYDENLNLTTPISVDEIFLPPNKTLEDIASEFLGSSDRWKEIAITNNLLPPYVDANSTTPRVKKPGDKLLIPRSRPAGSTNIPDSKPILITEGISQTEKNLGVDVEIDKNFDFILDSNNDFSLVAGGKNAAQAMILKLSLEKGSLKRHPNLGVGLNIGEKIRNGIDVRDDIILSILSDSRFENIKDMTFSVFGGTIKIDLNVIIKYLQTPLPVAFNV